MTGMVSGWFLLAIALGVSSADGGLSRPEGAGQHSKRAPPDFSSAESVVRMYFEANRTGDRKLIDALLAENAALNYEEAIEPNSCVVGPEIVRLVKIAKRFKFGDWDLYVEPSDVQVYVNVKYDPKCPNSEIDHRVIWVRKKGHRWWIIAETPGWPGE